jgi:GT2 family glycosyltransferase
MTRRRYEVMRAELEREVEVSLVIPVFNQLAYTRECLDSIGRCTDLTKVEIVVIDNGSIDGTRAFLERRTDITVVRCAENYGVAPAWNLGIEHSSGRYLSILNNDIIVTPGWLQRTLQVFAVQPLTWCVTPIFTMGDMQQDFWRLAELLAANPAEPLEGGIVGFCFTVQRHAFEEIGVFDERFEIAFCEDTDFYQRLLASGHPPMIATNVLIHHYGTKTAADLPAEGLEIWRRNEVRFAEKWGSMRLPGRDTYMDSPYGQFRVRLPA